MKTHPRRLTVERPRSDDPTSAPPHGFGRGEATHDRYVHQTTRHLHRPKQHLLRPYPAATPNDEERASVVRPITTMAGIFAEHMDGALRQHAGLTLRARGNQEASQL